MNLKYPTMQRVREWTLPCCGFIWKHTTSQCDGVLCEHGSGSCGWSVSPSDPVMWSLRRVFPWTPHYASGFWEAAGSCACHVLHAFCWPEDYNRKCTTALQKCSCAFPHDITELNPQLSTVCADDINSVRTVSKYISAAGAQRSLLTDIFVFRHFNLRMKRDTTLFSPDLIIDVSGEERSVDTSHIYSGEIFGRSPHPEVETQQQEMPLFY